MTISELGSLGEVIGAFGLIVTIVFLAMEMRMKRQDEIYRDIEHVAIRNQEINLLVAQSPQLLDVMTKFNKLTGGHFQPLPDSMTTERMKEAFDERELTMLVHYWYAAALGNEIFLTKENERLLNLVHFNLDTYNPTKLCLSLLKPYLKKGTIVIFDDFYGYPGWSIHENKAFEEFLIESQMKYKFVCFGKFECAMEIL